MKVKNYCDNEQSAVAAVSKYFPQISGDDVSCTREPNILNLGKHYDTVNPYFISFS